MGGGGNTCIIQIASEKQELFQRITEESKEASFSRDVGTRVPTSSFVCGVLRDWCIHWNGWYWLTGFSPWDEQRSVCTEECECVCCRLSGTGEELGCSVWHTATPTEDADTYTRVSSAWKSWLPRDLPRRGTQLPSLFPPRLLCCCFIWGAGSFVFFFLSFSSNLCFPINCSFPWLCNQSH